MLQVAEKNSLRELAKRLPEDAAKIRKLIEFTKPPAAPKPPPVPDDMPHPVTFFLTKPQRKRVLAVLRGFGADRTEASSAKAKSSTAAYWARSAR